MKFLNLILSSLLLLLLVSCSEDGGEDGSEDESSGRSPEKTPELAITDAPPVTLANQDAYRARGTCTQKGGIVTVSVESLNPQTETCSEKLKWQVTVDISPIDSGDLVLITAEESGKSVTLEVKRDTIRPEVAIGNNNPVVNSINQGDYELRGTCDEEGGEVVLDVGRVSSTASCDGANWVANGIDLSGLAADVTQVRVTADLADASGNPADQSSGSLVRDITPPMVGITSAPVINRESIDSYILEGTCEGNTGEGEGLMVAIGVLTQRVDCTNGRWSFSPSKSDLERVGDRSDLVISVKHGDAVGNIGLATVSVIKDLQAPQLVVTSELVINIAVQGSYTLDGTCSERGRKVSVAIGSDGVQDIPCSSDGEWTLTPRNGLAEESFTLAITQDDAAGNTTTLSLTLVKDITAPVFVFDSNLDINAANELEYYVSGTCEEDGTVTVGVGGLSGTKLATCSGGTWRSSAFDTGGLVSPSQVELSASMVDLAGNPGTVVNKVVQKDTSNRAVQITPPVPINGGNAANYPVRGNCSNHQGEVTVTVGGKTPSTQPSCTERTWSTTVDTSGVADGSAIVISATFGTGDDLASDEKTVLKDVKVPAVAITSPASGSFINAGDPGTLAISGTCDDGTAEIRFSHNLGTATCDGANFSASLDVSLLSEGELALTASIADPAGNTASAEVLLTKDTVVPAIEITSPVAGSFINGDNVDSFTVSGTCDDGTAEIRFSHNLGTATCDGTAFSRDLDFSSVGDGDLPLVVTIADAAGNSSEKTVVLAKDVEVPAVAITSPANGSFINAGDPSTLAISGTCDDGTATIRFSHNLGTATCDGANFSASLDVSLLSEGEFTLTASIADAAGNTASAEVLLTKDTVVPAIEITSPVAGSFINGDNVDSFTVSGTCDDGTAEIRFSHNLGTATCDGTAFNRVLDFSSVGDGDLPLVVTIADAAGNSSEETVVLAKDVEVPAVAITSPANGSFINAGDPSTLAISGSCDDGTATIRFSHNLGTATCDGANFSASLDVSLLSEGELALTASIADPAGNTSSAEVAFTKDTVVPAIEITSPVAGSSINGDNVDSFTVSGTCDDGTAPISFSHNLGTATCDGTAFSKDLDFSSLGDGGLALVVTIADAAGNSREATLGLVKDAITELALAITSPSAEENNINSINSDSFQFEGTCNDSSATIVFSNGIGSTTCDGTNFAVALDLSALSEGENTITATMTDYSSNTVNTSVTLVKDTIPPNIALTSPAAETVVTSANVSSFAVSGTCDEEGASITFSEGLGSTTCDGTTFNATLNMDSLDEGDFTLTAIIADEAGNEGRSELELIKNVVPPSIWIAYPPSGTPINLSNIAAFSIRGSCNEVGGEVTFSYALGLHGLERHSYSQTTTCDGEGFHVNFNFQSMTDSQSFRFYATITDAYGNSRTTGHSYTLLKDTIRPNLLYTAVSPMTISAADVADASSRVSVSGHCSDIGESPTATISFLDQSDVFICSTVDFTRQLDIIRTLPEGTTELSITVVDIAGNSATPATHTVFKDSMIPTIIASVSRTSITSADINTPVEVTGTCTNAESTDTITFSHGDIVGDSPSCNGGTFSGSLDFNSIEDGTLDFRVTISDGTNPSNHATAVIKKYVSVPSITFNPDLSLNIGADNLASFAVSGNCIDAEDTNTITFSHGEIVGTAPVCSEGTFSATLDFTSVDEGAIDFVATITDPLGNSSTTRLILKKDLVAPTLALASGLPEIVNSNNVASFAVSGTCTNAEPSDTITFSHGEIVGTSPSCSSGTFSATLDLQAVAEGNFNFTATINGGIHLYTTASVAIEKDAVPPVIVFNDTVSTEINSENEASFALSGTCTNTESADTITFSHGEIVGTSPSCSGGTFSATVDFSGLADGAINFGVTITNDKGSSSSTYLWLLKGEPEGCVPTGFGTLTSPMTICHYQGLKDIANGLNKHYILGSDIDAMNSWSEGTADCTPYDGTTIAASNPCGGMTPLGVFTGSLDGRDHLISHLYINASVNDEGGTFYRNQ